MSSNWINVTSKLKAGVALMNNIESSKLRLLLNRIASSMQQDQMRKSTKPPAFTEEEEAKLEKSLGLEAKDVQLILDTSTLILQQAAYHVMKPDLLCCKLTEELQMDSDKATVVVSVWSTCARSVVDNLKRSSVLPLQLADVGWLISVETSSDRSAKLKDPVAMLQLSLASSEGNSQKVDIEMRKADLQDIYHCLEHIQGQLDSLK